GNYQVIEGRRRRGRSRAANCLRSGTIEVDGIAIGRKRTAGIDGPVAANIDGSAVGAGQRAAVVNLDVVIGAAAGKRAGLDFKQAQHSESRKTSGARGVV